MLARRSALLRVVLCCLACWLCCVIVFGEFPELLSLTDNTSNDFAIRRVAPAENLHVLSIVKQGAVAILARAVEYAVEFGQSRVEDAPPEHTALFIIHSVLRR